MYNRISALLGNKVLDEIDSLEIKVYRKENNDVCASYEIHGSIGTIFDDDDDDDEGGGIAEKPRTDLSLLLDLIRRMQAL